VDYKVEKVVVKFDPEISGDENKKKYKIEKKIKKIFKILN